MTLKKYLKYKNIKLVHFAESVSTTKGNMSRWVNGGGAPNEAMMARIYDVTGGMVAPNDFFDFTRAADPAPDDVGVAE